MSIYNRLMLVYIGLTELIVLLLPRSWSNLRCPYSGQYARACGCVELHMPLVTVSGRSETAPVDNALPRMVMVTMAPTATFCRACSSPLGYISSAKVLFDMTTTSVHLSRVQRERRCHRPLVIHIDSAHDSLIIPLEL